MIWQEVETTIYFLRHTGDVQYNMFPKFLTGKYEIIEKINGKLMKKSRFAFVLFSFLTTISFALAISSVLAQENSQSFPGTKSDWNGFDCYDFKIEERPCKVVTPKTAADGNPWVWRAVFWGHEPQTEIELLKRGYHIAFVECSDLLGSPQMIKERNTFYKFLVEKHKFSPKPVLLGMSRGGICSLRWAIENPKSVSSIYIDAPVLDFKSWPGGKGKGVGSKGDWEQVLKVYNLTEEEAMAFKGNPVDALEPLAKEKVPVLIVYGDADEVVPHDENTLIFADKYKKLDAPIELIEKPGVGHHPHSLKDPTQIVKFILKANEKHLKTEK
ncbi:MAG: alpha/beta hydrolase family protein [Thermoguttaceae bacterium]